jgi:superfamily II DNA/RNA helicase
LPVRSSPSTAPSLEPTPCDATPVPYASLSLDARLQEGIRDLGFVETRPIQSAVIPLALAGDDLIACAETGTGKTAAFVVPTLQKLLTSDPDPRRLSRVLVLAPTRELAVQIEDEIHGLAYHTTATSAAVYGGVEMGPQERALKAGVDIIVATPGRLIDHMRQENADLSGIELLVLDEADRMMDMGFWPDVRRIIASLPPSTAGRQTLLFSATMPNEVVKDALEITRGAKYVQIGQRSAPPKSITHRIQQLPAGEKLNWLIEHLASRRPRPRLQPHEDRRGPARSPPRRRRHQLHRAARGPQPGSAPRRRRGIQERALQGARRDRHRGARPRHRRDPHGHQLRGARLARDVRASRGAYGTRG